MGKFKQHAFDPYSLQRVELSVWTQAHPSQKELIVIQDIILEESYWYREKIRIGHMWE